MSADERKPRAGGKGRPSGVVQQARGEILPKAPVKKRPGQPPPVKRARVDVPEGAAGDSGDAGDAGDDEQHYQPQQGAEEGERCAGVWSDKKRTQWVAWEQFAAAAGPQLVSGARLLVAQHAHLADQHRQQAQQRLNEGWRGHRCPQMQVALAAQREAGGAAEAQAAEAEGQLLPAWEAAGLLRDTARDSSLTEFVSLQFCVPVQLPFYKCTHCNAAFHAAHTPLAGCWPSSPVVPRYLYDLPLMVFYQEAERGGLSMTGVPCPAVPALLPRALRVHTCIACLALRAAPQSSCRASTRRSTPTRPM